MAAGVKLSERDAEVKLRSCRAEDQVFRHESFKTISAYGPNGAMMHYTSCPVNDKGIHKDSFYLNDSGCQYMDGTTDITRTFCFGEPTDAQKKDFTLVVKAMINLSQAIFLKGTRGVQLDVIAREKIWRHGINYTCSTGHGIGFYLNVHEGPHNIGMRLVDHAIEPGVVMSNEPGIYREGEHGIRIENIMLCKEHLKNEFGTFYAFEQLTFCPIETKAIDKSMLCQDEIDWLNAYHQAVYENLCPHLDDEHKAFLKEITQPI